MKISVAAFSVLAVFGLGAILYDNSKSEEPQAATGEVESSLTGEIPGWWFQEHFGASICEADDCAPDFDEDGDKLTNFQEYYYKSDPKNRDTNANGLTDGEDVAFGYAPDREGKVKFDELGTDDSIVGESLLFNNEIKSVISGMSDLNNLVLPEVSEAELNISNANSQAAFVDYMLEMDRISKKYYSNPEAYAGLGESIKQQNPAVISSLQLTALQVANDYKQVKVPSDMLTLHKHQIGLWSLVPVVIQIPASESPLEAVYNDEVNNWFDSAQAMIALNQKITIELIRLRQQYEFNIQE